MPIGRLIGRHIYSIVGMVLNDIQIKNIPHYTKFKEVIQPY